MVSFYNELTCGSSCTNLHEVKNCHSKKLFRWILFWPCSKWLLCLVPLHCARAFDDVGRTGIGLVSLLTDKAPDEEEVGAETAAAWRSSNDHVMGILCMSAEEPVRLSFISFSSAREMWEYLKQRYEHNLALKVTLMERHRVLRQQDMSIQEFTMCSPASHGSWTAWCWRPVMNVIVPKGGNLIRSFSWWTCEPLPRIWIYCGRSCCTTRLPTWMRLLMIWISRRFLCLLLILKLSALTARDLVILLNGARSCILS